MRKTTVADLIGRFTGASLMGKFTGGGRLHAGEVSRRAYEIYETRGGLDGHDIDDWLLAEGEVERRYYWEIPRGYP